MINLPHKAACKSGWRGKLNPFKLSNMLPKARRLKNLISLILHNLITKCYNTIKFILSKVAIKLSKFKVKEKYEKDRSNWRYEL